MPLPTRRGLEKSSWNFRRQDSATRAVPRSWSRQRPVWSLRTWQASTRLRCGIFRMRPSFGADQPRLKQKIGLLKMVDPFKNFKIIQEIGVPAINLHFESFWSILWDLPLVGCFNKSPNPHSYQVLQKKTAIPWSTTPQMSCPPHPPIQCCLLIFVFGGHQQKQPFLLMMLGTSDHNIFQLGVAGVSKVSMWFPVGGCFRGWEHIFRGPCKTGAVFHVENDGEWDYLENIYHIHSNYS